ncbi:translation initiation factor IF-2, partial [Streptococcus pneumoniae]
FKAVPAFGDWFEAVPSEKAARDQATGNQRTSSMKSLANIKKIDASDLTDEITAGKIKELNVVVKADVQGSLESLLDALGNLKNDEVAVKVVSS